MAWKSAIWCPLKTGSKPEFLKNRVAYYVLGNGAEDWRYADTLEAITQESRPLYLGSRDGHANELFDSGVLATSAQKDAVPDRYIYDPLDVSSAKVDAVQVPNMLTDQRWVLQQSGKYLIYHSAPFEHETEIAGFPKLTAFISLDQPDTDFRVMLFEIQPDGTSVALSGTSLRARYRTSMREAHLVEKGKVERYDFDHFTFTARRLQTGSRLRLIIAPMNTLYSEKNYNDGGVVAEETGRDARTVTATLYHDAEHPSALYIPIAAESRKK